MSDAIERLQLLIAESERQCSELIGIPREHAKEIVLRLDQFAQEEICLGCGYVGQKPGPPAISCCPERRTVRRAEVEQRLFDTERRLQGFSNQLAEQGYDNLDALIAVHQRNVKWLEGVCTTEHSWRSSTFHEKSSPHWICVHCGKEEPKKHDEWSAQVRVVEKQEIKS